MPGPCVLGHSQTHNGTSHDALSPHSAAMWSTLQKERAPAGRYPVGALLVVRRPTRGKDAPASDIVRRPGRSDSPCLPLGRHLPISTLASKRRAVGGEKPTANRPQCVTRLFRIGYGIRSAGGSTWRFPARADMLILIDTSGPRQVLDVASLYWNIRYGDVARFQHEC